MVHLSLRIGFPQVFINLPLDRAFLGISFVLLVAPSAHSEGEFARERFLQQYQPHAKALESAYTNIRVKWRQCDEIGQGKQSVGYIKGKYNRLNYRWDIEGGETIDSKKQIISRQQDDSIMCRNAHYSFQLRRPDKNKEYFLKKLTIYSGHEPILDVENMLSMLNVPYADCIKKKTYLEVAQDPKTHIVGFEDCLWQNKMRKALTTRFLNSIPGSKEQDDCITVYYFSPEEGWTCCGMKSYVADGSAREGLEERYEYGAKEGDQFPPLKRIEQWVYNLQEPSKSRLRGTIEIDEFHRSSVPFPDSDFRLSAFGLPEPMGVQPLPPSHSWLWLLAAALVAAGLALLFAWFKRRHANKPHAQAAVPSEQRLL